MGEGNQIPTRRRITVQEAAEVLGVTVEAVRGQIKRGKLEAEREKDGSVYVWIDIDQSTIRHYQPKTGHDHPTASQQPDDRLGNQEQLVESLLLISAKVAKHPDKIVSWTTHFQNRLPTGAKAVGSGPGNSNERVTPSSK